MKKFSLSLLGITCALALSACSSSSSGDNAPKKEQLKQEQPAQKPVANATEQKPSEVAKAPEAPEAAKAPAETPKEKPMEEAKAPEVAPAPAPTPAPEKEKEVEKPQPEMAKTPISDQILGGTTGIMKSGFDGVVLTEDQVKAAEEPKDHTLYALSVVDSKGRSSDLALGSTSYGYVGNSEFSPESLANSNKFNSMVFGIASGTEKYHTYLQGKPTEVAQLPTTGVFTYKGGVAYKTAESEYPSQSTANISADFAKKELNVNVEESKYTKVPAMQFDAKITGNTFAGESNGIKTQGGFFGENAKEVGGVFKNEATQAQGVFGGVKVEKE